MNLLAKTTKADDVELLVWSQSDSSGPRVDLTAVKLDNELVCSVCSATNSTGFMAQICRKNVAAVDFFFTSTAHWTGSGSRTRLLPVRGGGGGRLDSAGVGNLELENWKLISKISRLGVKSFIIMDQIYQSQARD